MKVWALRGERGVLIASNGGTATTDTMKGKLRLGVGYKSPGIKAERMS